MIRECLLERELAHHALASAPRAERRRAPAVDYKPHAKTRSGVLVLWIICMWSRVGSTWPYAKEKGRQIARKLPQKFKTVWGHLTAAGAWARWAPRSLGQLFGIMQTANDLITIAGIVIEAVSALGLVLFRETSKRLNTTSDRLHEIWRVLAAFKQAESIEGEKKTEMKMILISRLAGLPQPEVSDGKES